MEPMGGVSALCEALGGLIEYQGNDNPHWHGNMHLVSAYQHKTLREIAELIKEKVLSIQDFTDYYTALHQEDHCDQDKHFQMEPELEKRWSEHNKGPDGDRLCQLPAYMFTDNSDSLWSSGAALSSDDVSRKELALQDGEKYLKTYLADVQHVFSHCHHHWHPVDGTGQRRPIRGCRAKKGLHQCRSKFPLTQRLGLIPRVVCP